MRKEKVEEVRGKRGGQRLNVCILLFSVKSALDFLFQELRSLWVKKLINTHPERYNENSFLFLNKKLLFPANNFITL